MENIWQHQTMMRRCLQLALNGLGSTYPNPLVGSVIVLDDKIIGEGWHYKAGLPHAEINAINAVKDQSLLKKATLYVNLEPCSHFGKTPPCAHKIVAMGIPKVVIGTRDYASHVNGAGIAYLRNHGVEVIENVLVDECYQLNKRFFTYHQKKRPYIILKWAETKDGYFSPLSKTQQWITNPYSKQLVHLWRTQEEAILVGGQTIRSDNPQLNARLWKGNNPIKIVLSEHIRAEDHWLVFEGAKTIVLGSDIKKKDTNNPHTYAQETPNDMELLVGALYKKGIQSVIVEGGKKVLQQFIDANLWDEARILKGSPIWNQGVKSPILRDKKLLKEDMIVDNIYEVFLNNAL